MNPFLGKESDIGCAAARARKRIGFWEMVYSGQGISYTELKGMDLAEFYEAREAKRQYNERHRNKG